MKDATDNVARLAMLDRVAEEILAHPQWHPVDAVVFPGGFLSQIPDKEAEEFVTRLEPFSPGVQLIVGVDKDGEQLALAFNHHGESGRARKIFPVGEDVDGKTMKPITLHEKDFSDASRLIELPSGHKALLCVCYDMFGLSDTLRGKRGKLAKAVSIMDSDGQLYEGQGKSRSVLKRAFSAHQKMLRDQKPDVALATIHRFAAAGLDLFWQRHGVASASAALDGGLAIGAAHFGRLPEEGSSTLAANHVPAEHLEQGSFRAAHRMLPLDETPLASGSEKGVLRVFKP